MIDPASGFHKGYCFVTYCAPGESAKACELVKQKIMDVFSCTLKVLFFYSLMVMKSVQEKH